MADQLTRSGLARVTAVAEAHVASGDVPGVVALVARGDHVHVEARGALTVGGPPVRADSPFRIASVTKPVTGAAALALAEEGLLALDEPVDRLLPELAAPRVLRRPDGPLDDTVPARRPITVRDLLTFTPGFGMSAGMFGPEPWPVVRAADDRGVRLIGPPQPATHPDADTWIAALGSLPLLAQPGEQWLYDTPARALGVLLARAAGAPLAEVLRTRVLAPLGMGDTGFWAADTSRLPTAYASGPEGLTVWDPPAGQWSAAPPFEDGAGGLVSTAPDLLAFGRMLLRGGAPVLPSYAVRAMTTGQLTAQQRAGQEAFLADGSWGFCLAVTTTGPRAGAFGWAGGLGTTWLVDPGRDLVVVVLTQRLFDSAGPPDVHRDLQDAAYAACG